MNFLKWTVLVGFAVFYIGCGSNDKGTNASVSTDEIIGTWGYTSLSASVVVSIMGRDSTWDSSVTVPEGGGVLELRKEGTYTLTTSAEIDNILSLLDLGNFKLLQNHKLGVENGSWELANGVLTTISDDLTAPDTLKQTVTIMGDEATFNFKEDVIVFGIFPGVADVETLATKKTEG